MKGYALYAFLDKGEAFYEIIIVRVINSCSIFDVHAVSAVCSVHL